MAVKAISRPKAVRALSKSKPVTMKTINEAFVRMTESMAASRADTERAAKEARAETERAIREARAETERALKASREETERVHRETERLMAESKAKLDESLRKLSEDVRKVTSGIGTMGRKLGDLVEVVVIPGIRREINRYGHDFKRALANKVVWYRGQMVTEVDLFLYNGAEAMAAEVKAGVTLDEVKDHLKRLRALRKHEAEANIKGKLLYGAMVGIYIEDNAREYALKNGLYVLEIIEEENKLTTDAPKRPAVW